MKTLMILRHAKSSWKEAGQADYDRPLNKRGKRTAPAMGKMLADNDLLPDLIVSSSAVRAKETVHLLVAGSLYEGQVVFEDDLYLAPGEMYIEAAANLDDAINCVMMVGHNPGLEHLVGHLSGGSHMMPTAALAHFELPIERWIEFDSIVRGDLKDLYIPRELGIE